MKFGHEATPAPGEIAHYCPEPSWLADEGRWIKSLLLFSEGSQIADFDPEVVTVDLETIPLESSR